MLYSIEKSCDHLPTLIADERSYSWMDNSRNNTDSISKTNTSKATLEDTDGCPLL